MPLVQAQGRVLATMLAAGAAMGAAYDASGALHALCRGGRGLRAALDAALALLFALGVIRVALELHTDAFRWYVFGGMAAGFTLYMITLGTIVRIIVQKFRRSVKKGRESDKKFRI